MRVGARAGLVGADRLISANRWRSVGRVHPAMQGQEQGCALLGLLTVRVFLTWGRPVPAIYQHRSSPQGVDDLSAYRASQHLERGRFDRPPESLALAG